MDISGISGDPHTGELAFARDGYFGPVRLFTPAQCALIVRAVRFTDHPTPADWIKGRAVTDRFFHDLATRPAVLALLIPVLGPDIVLWGVDVIERDPGQIHPWHTDSESSDPAGGFASIWIGIDNTSRDSALQVISCSHRLGTPIQGVIRQKGLRRGDASDETVLAWARERDPLAELVQPDMRDGDAIVYDGRLWHATNNKRSEGRRIALLLQYAAAGRPTRIPASGPDEWPLRFRDRPAPTIVVTGRGEEAVNTVSPPPACVESPYRLTSCVERIELPETGMSAVNRQRLLVGPTSLLNSLEIHCSMLAAGQRAHAPHRHSEESLLLGFDGAFEVLANESPGFEDPRVYPVSGGSLIYQPSYEQHCVGNSSDAAASYLVLSWRGPALETDDPAPATLVAAEPSHPEDTQPFRRDVLFERQTAYLEKLHVHMSTLQPGAGYAPHVDDYDVVIVLLSGTIETLGRIVTARSLIYYAAGEPHGLRNAGHDVARYAVVEFHAPRRRTRNRDTFPLVVAASGPQGAKRRVEEFRTFWSGPPLSAYEKLGLASLTARGQRLLLYSYDRALRVPDGVDLVDANEILPADRVHEIKLANGETAPTIHANLFRYETLRRLGGWYVDLDVVLIADEPPAAESYIGRQDGRLVNNAILRFAPDAPLMTAAVEAARGLMTSTEIGASGPTLMTRLIDEMKLEDLVVPRLAAYPVRTTEVLQLFLPEHREELESRIAGADFLHLWNQIWRRVRIPKDLGPPEGSFLDGLFRSFGFRFAPSGRMQAEAVRSWFREYFVLLEAKAATGGVAAMAELAHALAAAKAERGEAEAALARTSADQARLAELADALDYARWERDEVLKSTSWRVTAPLRTVARSVKQLLRR